MDLTTARKYFADQGLDKYFENVEPGAIPPHLDDLARIHQLIRERKSFTVLEFGVGFSSLIIADALKRNQDDWDKLETKPKIRNRFMFKCFSVDSSEKWMAIAKSRIPESLAPFISFQFSRVKIGTFNGQLCHFYETLPDIIPDFIYLDGPDPATVEGTVNGLSFQCPERTVMSGDLLLMESTFLPGTFIIVDGRTNNVRFLKNNFKRNYKFNWDKAGDVSTFELTEERLGKYNLLGSDFF
jgi:hypothetical protein